MFTKKNISLLFLTCSCIVTAQIGINTISPTEALDSNGTVRLRNLPVDETPNSIFTQPDGTAAENRSQTFKATSTVVADANGVIGIVQGLPVITDSDIKAIQYTAKTTLIDSGVLKNSITMMGNIAVYLEAVMNNNTGEQPIRFALLNGINDNVVVNEIKVGSGGLYGGNQTFVDVQGFQRMTEQELRDTTPFYNQDRSNKPPYPSNWIQITTEKPNINNRDFAQYMITLINTKEIYRVSIVVNGPIISGVINSPAQVTFFIERLTNQ